METVITTQTEVSDVREVRLVRTDDEANKLLDKGWELMNTGVSHIGATGYQAKPHYILARMGKRKGEQS
ncbi:hypothetical protein LCGC14_1565910 [marine sediment metagenome]|uniref:DUF1737 domain-containing protein n=1 Tax=marine sediment metagenome TaxID=412755 RepID=A0A0F9IL32_9ZZZZ